MDAFKYLISEKGFNPNLLDESGYPPIYHVTNINMSGPEFDLSQHGDVDVGYVRFLVDAGAGARLR